MWKHYLLACLTVSFLAIAETPVPSPATVKPPVAVKKPEGAPVLAPPAAKPTTVAPTAVGTKDMVPAEPTAPFKAPEGQVRAQVTKFDKRRHRVSISDDPYHTWQRKDSVCIFRGTRAMACGKVIAVGIKGAVVQITQHSSAGAVKPGDEARYFEPEKKMPEITDEELASETLMEGKPYSYNITLGYNLSLDLMYPILHFYWSVSPEIAIGLSPGYVSKTGSTPDSKLSGFGGLLTASYFGDEYFRGMWLMLGSGFYHFTASNATLTETSNYPLLQFTVGWREDWAHGLNVAAAIGGRFLSPLNTSGLTEVAYPSIHPIALLEVGISF